MKYNEAMKLLKGIDKTTTRKCVIDLTVLLKPEFRKDIIVYAGEDFVLITSPDFESVIEQFPKERENYNKLLNFLSVLFKKRNI